MPGFAGMSAIGAQFLAFLLSGAPQMLYYRPYVPGPAPSASPGIPPAQGSYPNSQPVGTRSATWDSALDLPTDTLAPDLGTGWQGAYQAAGSAHVLVRRGDTQVAWERYGLRLEEQDTWGLLLASEVPVCARFDAFQAPDGNTYQVDAQIKPITVLDTIIGWAAQLGRRDPLDVVTKVK